MKNAKRLVALALALCLVVGLCACAQQPDGSTTTPIAGPTPTSAPTQSERFAALDLKIFTDYVTSDGLTFHLTLKDPAALGIEAPEATWGDFSEEVIKQTVAYANAYLQELAAIDRAQLTEREQLAYDVLRQQLEQDVASAAYYYYYEPFTEYSGAQTNLPMNLTFYTMETQQDVEDYLSLLGDLPRYLGDLLAYEQGKSQAGLFMRREACEAVIQHCDDFIDSGDTCFLIGTFNDALAEVEGVSDARRGASNGLQDPKGRPGGPQGHGKER